MDYSYYTTSQTSYQFQGFPQPSDEPQQCLQMNGWTGPTSPPNNQNLDAAFDTFDQVVHEADGFVPPHLQDHRQSLQSPAPSRSPPNSVHVNGRRASLSESNINTNNDLVQNVAPELVGEEFVSRNRSSSEEKDPSAPQSKRKAQNRAAQRAFRERKERHVKELEAKLNELEQASTSLQEENERLKRELAKISTENEILRATSSATELPTQSTRGGHSIQHDNETIKTVPMKYTPTDFVTAIQNGHSHDSHTASKTLGPLMTESHHNYKESKNIPLRSSPTSSSADMNPHPNSHRLTSFKDLAVPSVHRIALSPLTGERLLSASATWDYIQAHQQFQDGLVDIADVSERLKGLEQCDGTGPSFEEGDVRKAIMDSAKELKG